MKRLLIFFVLALVSLFTDMMGCDGGPSGGLGILSVTIDSVDSAGCGICFNDPCTRTYYLSVKDSMPGTGKYYPHYWAEMSYGNQSVVGGLMSPGYVQNGVYDIIPVQLKVHYYDLPPNVYTLTVYRTDVLADANLWQNYQSHFTMGAPVQIGGWCADCFDYCCSSDSLPPIGWYHSQIEGQVPCVGISATIESRYGILCGEPFGSSSKVAHSLSHVSMYRFYGGGTSITYIEMGFWRHRLQGGGIERGIFGQVKDSSGVYHTYELVGPADIDNHCPEGNDCEYVLWFDQTTGEVIFKLNNEPPLRTLDQYPEWTGVTGDVVLYGGEVRGFECDMSGTVADPCTISQCLWYDGTNWHPTLFSQWVGNKFVSDTAEWGLEIYNDQTVAIWDKRTL